MSINFLNPRTNPFQTSEIRRIQDFYGIKYEDLSSVEKMKGFGLKQSEIDYCLENRDKEFALRSTEGFELRDGILGTDRFRKLKEYYGFTLQDTQSIDKLKTYGLKEEDIDFITGRDLEPVLEVKKEVKPLIKKVGKKK